jgi:hypothetical protein
LSRINADVVPSTQWFGRDEAKRCGEELMTTFQVKFFKNLLSSDGHRFCVLQRVIPVGRCETVEDAIRTAQHRFERLEQVPDWRLHADFVETCAEQRRPRRSTAA